MTKLSIQKNIYNKKSVWNYSHKHLPYRTILALLSFSTITGCIHLHQPPVDEMTIEPTPTPRQEVQQLQNEVKQLQKTLAKKDAKIREQQAHKQDQTIEQQDTTSEVTRVKAKLNRLATKPSAASRLAEAEVAMQGLKRGTISAPDKMLQKQAQYLLDAALLSYEKSNYGVAMNNAAQAHAFIKMTADKNRNQAYSVRTIVPIHSPVSLQATADINLRKEPHDKSETLDLLKKGSSLITNAYHGNWLQVQTDEGRQGWVFNKLIRAIVRQPLDGH